MKNVWVDRSDWELWGKPRAEWDSIAMYATDMEDDPDIHTFPAVVMPEEEIAALQAENKRLR